MKKIVLKNGNIIDETLSEPLKKDILIEEESVSEVANNITGTNCEIIDCSNLTVLPSLFDMHVHLREPGFEYKETVNTGTKAALNGGITGVAAMPNTEPAIDGKPAVLEINEIINKTAVIPVYQCGTITKNREGLELSNIKELAELGIKMITDDGSSVENSKILEEAMIKSKEYGLIIGSHCEKKNISADGVINEGYISEKLDLPGIPSISEEICIERDIKLSEITDCRLHIQHVSTAKGLDIINKYREKGANVTCEVTPHHLIFSEEDITCPDTNYKMNPPLRTPADNEYLIEGLRKGLIDCIATDHAPHSSEEKNNDILNAPFGITGLETALVSLFSFLIKTKKISWNILIKTFSSNPRRIMGLKPVHIKQECEANLVIFDENGETEFNKEYFMSKSLNSPFLGQKLNGKIKMVLYKGKILLDRRND